MFSQSSSNGRSRFLLIAPLIAAALFLLSISSASAAPAAYYTLPGSNSQYAGHLAAGENGSMWVLQQVTFNEAEPKADELRVLHLSVTGNIEATSPSLVGEAESDLLVPSSDGGVWLLGWTSGLNHIAANGSVIHISHSFSPLLSAITEGQDGSAWLISCSDTDQPTANCEVFRVTNNGEITSSTFSLNGEYISVRATYPTPDGLWLRVNYRPHNTGPWLNAAAYVTYSGTATAIPLPNDATVVGVATGDSAWWKQEQSAVTTFGLVSNTDSITTLANEPRVSNSSWADVTTAIGSTGNLVWAEDGTNEDGTQEYDGQIGNVTPSGATHRFLLPSDSTAIPSAEKTVWGGTCQFAIQVYEASDGSLWTLSSGFFSVRLTRNEPDGQLNVYVLGERSWNMTQASDGQLWFSLRSAGPPQVVRMNPTDPPPAEPHYPGNGHIENEEGPVSKHHAGHDGRLRRRIVAALNRALSRAERRLTVLEKGAHTARFPIAFPVSGIVSAHLLLPSGRAVAVVGTGHLSRNRGRGQLVLKTTKLGETLMHIAPEPVARLILKYRTHSRPKLTVQRSILITL